MKKDSSKTLVLVLAILVVILSILVIYAFVLKPTINGYVIKSQNDGVALAVGSIIAQIQQQGYAEIPFGNESIILVPYEPSEQELTVSLVG